MMSVKAMVFVDGSWIKRCQGHIAWKFNASHYAFDYDAIISLIQTHITACLNCEAQVMKKFFFASRAVNKPDHDANQEEQLYRTLQQQYFTTKIYNLNFYHDANNKRQEKCVDTGLVAEALYYAAIPNSFDIAALVVGDQDYLPLVEKLHQLGRQTMIATFGSIGSMNVTYKRFTSDPSIGDLPPLLLENYLTEIKATQYEAIRTCKDCGKKELTTFAGVDFYCNKHLSKNNNGSKEANHSTVKK